MRIRIVVASLATALTGVLAAPAAANAVEAGPDNIIGGSTVASAPWAAAVFSNGSFTCSGTIISANYVLTARHCIGGTMSVRVGSVNRSSGGVTRSVSSTSTMSRRTPRFGRPRCTRSWRGLTHRPTPRR